MRVSLLLPVCLIVFLGLAGCFRKTTREGPETVKVTGTIMLDGEPVDGAHVSFSPDAAGPVAFAVSDKRGRYELTTFEPGDGAIPGLYGISVTKEIIEGGMEFENQAAMEAYIKEHGERPTTKVVNLLPEKYSRKRTSGLTAEISAAKKNHIELQLKEE